MKTRLDDASIASLASYLRIMKRIMAEIEALDKVLRICWLCFVLSLSMLFR